MERYGTSYDGSIARSGKQQKVLPTDWWRRRKCYRRGGKQQGREPHLYIPYPPLYGKAIARASHSGRWRWRIALPANRLGQHLAIRRSTRWPRIGWKVQHARETIAYSSYTRTAQHTDKRRARTGLASVLSAARVWCWQCTFRPQLL